MSGDAAFFVVVPLVIAVLAAIVWIGASVWRPTMFVMNGHWEAARIAADRIETGWLRAVPGALAAAHHARALGFHLEGRFEESLVATKYVTSGKDRDVLEAANLVMLNREPKRAVHLLEPLCTASTTAAEDVLLFAVAQHMAGRRTKAQQAFERAGAARAKNAPWPRLNEPVFHYLRALYLVRVGRATDAQDDLRIAASSLVRTAYVDRAKALLPPTSSARDVDPRSSLDAQVMGESED